MNRRAAIALTPDEVAAFLAEQRTVTCATLGRDGWPHLMPLWYVVREAEAVIHRERDVVAALGEAIAVRYGGAPAGEYVARQATKRVALPFRPRESATWDHRKL